MDCFAILGLRPTASIDEIGKAFRRLAQKVHPDHRPGSATASCEFQRLHEAYLDAIVQAGQRERTSVGAFTFGGRAYVRETDGRILQWNAMARSWRPIS